MALSHGEHRLPSPHSIPRSRPSSSHAHRPPEPTAIVFDLDGTLVDTVGTRIEAWLEVFERYRLPATHEQVAALIGIDGRRLAREVAAAAGLPIDDELCEDIDQVCGEIFERRNRAPDGLRRPVAAQPAPLPRAH